MPGTSAKAAILGLTRGLAIDGSALGIRANAVMPLASTPMNSSLPDKEVARQFRENFPVEQAAALILLLAHEQAPASGETFVTGGGFTARVSLVMGPGVVPEEPGPEALLAQFDEAMSLLAAVPIVSYPALPPEAGTVATPLISADWEDVCPARSFACTV